MMKLLRMYKAPALVLYFIVAILVLAPAFKSGQLFLLDMPWPEKFTLSNYTRSGIPTHYPVLLIFWLVSHLIAPWLLQKVLLVSLLTLAGYGMHRLLISLSSRKFTYLGGLFYLANPFVLDRLKAGHWLVLLGYAILPFLVYSLLTTLNKPIKKNLLKTFAFWLSLSMSIHYFYITTIVLFPAVVFLVFKREKFKKLLYSLIKSRYAYMYLVTVIVSILLLSGYYIKASEFTDSDFRAFATRGWVDVLTLKGFWYFEGPIPEALSLTWVLVCYCILAVTVILLFKLSKKRPFFAGYIFASLCFLAVVTIGYASPITKNAVDLLRSLLPGFEGLRDTQKLTGFLAFAYALTLGLYKKPYCITDIMGSKNKLKNSNTLMGSPAGVFFISMYAVVLVTLGISVVDSYKHLKTYNYPNDWKKVNSLLVESNAKKVLALPWEGYIKLPFADNRFVANPASVYFSVPTDTRKNSGNLSLDYEPTNIDNLISSLNTSDGNVGEIKSLGYDYILVLRVNYSDNILKTLHYDASLPEVFAGDSLVLFKL